MAEHNVELMTDSS